ARPLDDEFVEIADRPVKHFAHQLGDGRFSRPAKSNEINTADCTRLFLIAHSIFRSASSGGVLTIYILYLNCDSAEREHDPANGTAEHCSRCRRRLQPAAAGP